MVSERGKYKMSPQQAMAREMAYRKRLELMHQIQSCKSKKLLTPSSETSSLPASIPNSERGPTRILNLRPKLIKDPSPNSIPQPVPLSNPRPNLIKDSSPKSSPEAVPFSRPRPRQDNPIPFAARGLSSQPRPIFSSQASQRPLYPYQIGPRPTAVTPSSRPKALIPGPSPYMPRNLAPRPWAKSSHVGLTTGSGPSLQQTPPAGHMFESTLRPSHKRKEAATQEIQADHKSKMSKLHCEVCNVHCTSSENLEMHFMGQKHQAQMKKGKAIGKATQDPRIYCKLCDIWCMNDLCFKQHLSGKHHILKLRS